MFTFRKHQAVGRYRSFETEYSDIKIKGMVVGCIAEAEHFSKVDFEERFSIRLMVVDPVERKGFKWITLKKKFGSDSSAREFLKSNFERITNQFDLYKCAE